MGELLRKAPQMQVYSQMKNSLSLLNDIIKYAQAQDNLPKPSNKNLKQTGESWLTHNLKLLEKTIKEESAPSDYFQTSSAQES